MLIVFFNGRAVPFPTSPFPAHAFLCWLTMTTVFDWFANSPGFFKGTRIFPRHSDFDRASLMRVIDFVTLIPISTYYFIYPNITFIQELNLGIIINCICIYSFGARAVSKNEQLAGPDRHLKQFRFLSGGKLLRKCRRRLPTTGVLLRYLHKSTGQHTTYYICGLARSSRVDAVDRYYHTWLRRSMKLPGCLSG